MVQERDQPASDEIPPPGPVVVLMGPDGSGKDAVAEYLRDHCGFLFVKTRSEFGAMRGLVTDETDPLLALAVFSYIARATFVEARKIAAQGHSVVIVRSPMCALVNCLALNERILELEIMDSEVCRVFNVLLYADPDILSRRARGRKRGARPFECDVGLIRARIAWYQQFVPEECWVDVGPLSQQEAPRVVAERIISLLENQEEESGELAGL